MYSDCVFKCELNKCHALMKKKCAVNPDLECKFYKSNKDYTLDVNGYAVKIAKEGVENGK